MSRKKLDRRIQKTLQLLQDALVTLISEKDYDDITIQEILDHANVGRSTFYAHFENKDQLLRSILTYLNEKFEEGIREMSNRHQRYEDNSANMPYRVLEFVAQNQRLFKAMLGKQQNNMLNNPLYNYLYIVTLEHFKAMIQLKDNDALKSDMAAHYYTSALIGALIWWLENDMVYSAQEFSLMVNQLTLPGLKEAFEN